MINKKSLSALFALGLGALSAGCASDQSEERTAPNAPTPAAPGTVAPGESGVDYSLAYRSATLQRRGDLPSLDEIRRLQNAIEKNASDGSENDPRFVYESLMSRLGGSPTPVENVAASESCNMVKFDAIGRILTNFGVRFRYSLPVRDENLSSCPALSGAYAQPADWLYCDARAVLGLPRSGARLAEANLLTPASAAKLHDLYLAAAWEIRDRIGSQPNYRGLALFNADNTCTAEGVSVLQGYSSTPEQVALCSRLVSQTKNQTNTGFDPELGKVLAIGSILSANVVCE